MNTIFKDAEATPPVDTSPGKQFSTDHLLHDIGTRAVSGGVVTIGAQATKFLLNFLAAAVLARLLSPKDFGLVGMVLGVIAIVGVFKELGLSTATVQRENITQQQVSNLFWINVGVCAVLALVNAGLAPLVARFYHDPAVTGIMLSLSVIFLLTGSTVQHQALLARQMRFPTLAIIDVSSIAIGFGVGCLLAWMGFSYWALVAQQLVTAAFGLVFTWISSGWRPSLPSRNSGVMPLISFGAHISVADFIGQFSANSDNILIGRLFGAAPLGLYTRANVLVARPMQQVVTPINSVLIPVLSRLQNDPERYRRSFLRAYDTLALLVFPFSAACLVLARPLVLTILGPKWVAVVPLFSAFTLVAISGPLSSVCTWIYESQGRGQDQLRNHTIAGGVTIGAYLLGLRWGPLGLILSLAVTSLVIRMPIVYHIAGRKGPVSSRDLWIAFLAHVPCWLTVLLTTGAVYKLCEHFSPLIQLLVCAPIGVATGAALMFLFRRPRQSALAAWSMISHGIKTRLAAI